MSVGLRNVGWEFEPEAAGAALACCGPLCIGMERTKKNSKYRKNAKPNRCDVSMAYTSDGTASDCPRAVYRFPRSHLSCIDKRGAANSALPLPGPPAVEA